MIPRSCCPKLSNTIIQKGLVFESHWSGTDATSGRTGRSESCPAGLMAEVGLRWCGGTPRQTERRISMTKSAKNRSIPLPAKPVISTTSSEEIAQASPGKSAAAEFQASSRYRNAPVALRRYRCRDDGGHRLATAFGARLSCRRCAQAPQTAAQFKEGRRRQIP